MEHLYSLEVARSSLVPRPRPAFRRLQYGLIVTESWVGPGNKAKLGVSLLSLLLAAFFWRRRRRF